MITTSQFHSPLENGAVIRPTDEICMRVWDIVEKNKKENLARGLICEYTHNQAFELAGWKFDTTFTTDVYDRAFGGCWQDDKLATYRDGKLSTTHTISVAEMFAWEKQEDVIIHSFEEMPTEDLAYCYRGAISVRKLQENSLIKSSNFDSGFWFNRVEAYRHARV